VKSKHLFLAALILIATASAKKHERIRLVPGHCVRITNFDEVAKQFFRRDKSDRLIPAGYIANKVHFVIKSDPDCGEFDGQNILHLARPE